MDAKEEIEYLKERISLYESALADDELNARQLRARISDRRKSIAWMREKLAAELSQVSA